MKMLRKFGAIALGGAVAALLSGVSGCAGQEPLERGFEVSRRLPDMGNQGAAHELVFPSPTIELARANGEAGDLADFTRNDAALGVGSQRPRMALDSWTDLDRPSLRESRQINIPQGHGRFLYFDRSGYGYGGGRGGGYGGGYEGGYGGGYGRPGGRPAHPYGHTYPAPRGGRDYVPRGWDGRSWW